MIQISNRDLNLIISEKGAEWQSIQYQGREYLWQGDEPGAWTERAPVLFPVIGGYPGGFVYRGERTDMPFHGFADTFVFTLEAHDDTSCTFCLTSNDSTKQYYPCDFEFRITYTLEKNAIFTTYRVLNIGESDMHFALGHHGGYLLDGGNGKWKAVFETCEAECDMYTSDDAVLMEVKEQLKVGRAIPLNRGFFERKCMVFTNLASEYVVLYSEEEHKKITVQFGDFSYVTLWHERDAKYLCIEPWSCKSTHFDNADTFEKQEGVILVKPGEESLLSFCVWIENE